MDPPQPAGARSFRRPWSTARREQQILGALGSEPQSPQSVAELLRRIYADVDPNVHHLAERSLLSGLIKLEEEGRVRKGEAGYSLAP